MKRIHYDSMQQYRHIEEETGQVLEYPMHSSTFHVVVIRVHELIIIIALCKEVDVV